MLSQSSGLLDRCLVNELLDELPPRDPRARRSRRDLRYVNSLMRHHAILARELRSAPNGNQTLRITELGAGDGHFLLAVAKRLNGRWPRVEATLVDRLPAFDPRIAGSFAALGWRVSEEVADAFDWLRQPHFNPADVITGNLVLHHFPAARLAELFRLASCSTHAFIALEPRRARWPHWCSRRLWLIGCGAVTRHDAPASVRAGFTGRELSALWPDAERWELIERPAGLFSHLFVARRKR